MSNSHPSSTHAERLRALLALADITADKLGTLAGLSPAHIGMLIRGDIKAMRSDTARAIARTTGCSLDWLLCGDGEPPTQDVVRSRIADAIAQTTSPTLPPPAPEAA